MFAIMRRISWLKAAWREFGDFPEKVQRQIAFGLDRAAEGSKAHNAKPLHGIDGGVFEISADDRSGTYRAVYAVKLGTDIWVVHAFQKKSVRGIKTPQREIDLIRERIKRLREGLR
jgi:phage-related protein